MAKLSQTERRTARVRKQLKDRSAGRLRLSIFRSGKNIYAQIIDDQKGVTLVAASSIDKELKSRPKSDKKAAASEVGKLVAERARKAGVKDVVFDRGAYRYHGRVKALADGAREAGLNF
ncbi:MAG: 50S ribosomal protein L18 [Aestuariivirgaceae bacterium]